MTAIQRAKCEDLKAKGATFNGYHNTSTMGVVEKVPFYKLDGKFVAVNHKGRVLFNR